MNKRFRGIISTKGFFLFWAWSNWNLEMLVCDRFDSWLIKTRNIVLYRVLQQETSCTVIFCTFYRVIRKRFGGLTIS